MGRLSVGCWKDEMWWRARNVGVKLETCGWVYGTDSGCSVKFVW